MQEFLCLDRHWCLFQILPAHYSRTSKKKSSSDSENLVAQVDQKGQLCILYLQDREKKVWVIPLIKSQFHISWAGKVLIWCSEHSFSYHEGFFNVKISMINQYIYSWHRYLDWVSPNTNVNGVKRDFSCLKDVNVTFQVMLKRPAHFPMHETRGAHIPHQLPILVNGILTAKISQWKLTTIQLSNHTDSSGWFHRLALDNSRKMYLSGLYQRLGSKGA